MNSLQRCKPLLGTYVDISIAGNVSELELIKASDMAFTEIERIQSLMSFHDKSSELFQINNHLLHHSEQPYKVSSDMLKVLQLALHLYKISMGYFDITIAPHLVKQDLLPEYFNTPLGLCGNSSHLTLNQNYLWGSKPVCIDLGGIAKGYAVDAAIKKLPLGLSYTINAGGDLYESHWENKHISIKYAERDTALKTIKMKNQALATSGNYYLGNQSDIINPQNQQPYPFKGSVSVFSESVMLADALTKVVVLAPRSITKFLLNTFDAQAVLINRWGFKRQIL